MKSLPFFAATLALISLSGCATTSINTRTGYGFITETTEAITATAATGKSKTGEACSTNILGIYSSGDSSIEAAKAKGGIKTVSTVDAKVFSVGPFYGKVCTIVHGE